MFVLFYAVFGCFCLCSRLSAVSKSLGALWGSKAPKTSRFLVCLCCFMLFLAVLLGVESA